MATIGNTYATLAHLLRTQTDGGEIADIIEVLRQSDHMLDDAPVQECNMGTRHLTTIRAGLPEPTWRKLYEGVQPGVGTETTVQESTGQMEAWSETDAKLVELAKNPQRFRMTKAEAHIQGMMLEAGRTVLYGDVALEPTKFTGLTARFSDSAAGNGAQLVDAGGVGSTNTSIWFVTWGADCASLLYPEGTRGGLSREDKGKQTKEVEGGKLYDVYREKFTWDIGMTVGDWRGISRIANIDTTKLGGDHTDDAYDGAHLIDLMIDAYYKLDVTNRPGGRTVVYTDRMTAANLHKQAMNGKNMNLTLEQADGRPVINFLGHPIRRMDALLATESAVTFA